MKVLQSNHVNILCKTIGFLTVYIWIELLDTQNYGNLVASSTSSSAGAFWHSGRSGRANWNRL